jgi:hypothetical protein
MGKEKKGSSIALCFPFHKCIGLEAGIISASILRSVR